MSQPKQPPDQELIIPRIPNAPGRAYTTYQQAAAFSATEEICQQAATAVGKIAEVAESGFAEVEQLIVDGEKGEAFKKLLLLKRQFAGSEFADKATEKLKALNSD